MLAWIRTKLGRPAGNPSDNISNFKSRMCVPTPRQLLAHYRLFRTVNWIKQEDGTYRRTRVLDPLSWLCAYRRWHHPVWLVHRNAAGELLGLRFSHNLRTNAGGDWQYSQMAGTPGNAAIYLGLTNDATAPSSVDTSLTSEIATNGLARKAATPAHTAVSGTSASTVAGVYTLAATWTATATQSAQKCGVFTAVSVGTMSFENTFTPVTLNNGDTLTLTYQVTY